MDRLDKISQDIAEIKTSQKVMERDIAHHIKRTDLAEQNLDLLRQEVKPLKHHVAMWEGAKIEADIMTVKGVVSKADCAKIIAQVEENQAVWETSITTGEASLPQNFIQTTSDSIFISLSKHL